MKVFIRKEAERDISDAYRWYLNQSPMSAEHFLQSVDQLLKQLRYFPQSYPILNKHTRKASLRRFPYNVYYCVHGEDVEVHAVFHQKRQTLPQLIR